jgi:hypothetical protein
MHALSVAPYRETIVEGIFVLPNFKSGAIKASVQGEEPLLTIIRVAVRVHKNVTVMSLKAPSTRAFDENFRVFLVSSVVGSQYLKGEPLTRISHQACSYVNTGGTAVLYFISIPALAAVEAKSNELSEREL